MLRSDFTLLTVFSSVGKKNPNISFLLKRYVSKRRANMKRHREASPTFSRGAEQRKLQKQLDLAKTLSVTVLAFVLCLSPYGITILLHLENLNPLVKKVNVPLSCRQPLPQETVCFKI